MSGIWINSGWDFGRGIIEMAKNISAITMVKELATIGLTFSFNSSKVNSIFLLSFQEFLKIIIFFQFLLIIHSTVNSWASLSL